MILEAHGLSVVDFRSRTLAFRGRALSFTGVNAYFLVAISCGNGASASLVSSVPLFLLDKEGFGSETSHEENVILIFEESRTFYSNQPFKGERESSNTNTSFVRKTMSKRYC